MPRRSLDVADVKAMLRMADREWQNNGLIAMDKGGEQVDYRMMRYLDAYRGQYPDSLPGATQDVDQFVGNLLFSLINTLMAQTSARDPEPVLRPLGGTAAKDDGWRRAWLNQKVAYSMIREGKYRREVDRALMSACISPMGFVRHGYTPDLEEYEKDGVIHERFKNHTPQIPWIQFLRPWQFRIDPLVNHFDMDGEPAWVAFQNLYSTKSDIRANPALIARDDWKPTFHYDLRPYHERYKPKVAHGTNIGATKKDGDSISMWEEWVVYDARRRTFFGVSHGSDDLVREEREWPLEWGQLPGSILTLNEQMDSPFGIPFPDMIWHEQKLYNRIWTILNALVTRFRRLIVLNESAFDADELELVRNPEALMEFIVAKGSVGEAINEIGYGQLDGQLIGLLFQLKEQIREVLGISAFDRGQRANVETASEANQIGAGGALARSRVQGRFEAFWVDIIRTSHRALLQTEDARKFFIPVIGETNTMFLTEGEIASGFVEAGLQDLQGEFDYGVRLNSTTPLDPAAEFTKVSTLYEQLGGAPDGSLVDHVYMGKRMSDLAGEDSERVIVSRDIANQMGQQNPGEATPPTQPPQAGDIPNLQQVTGGAG